MLRHRKPGVCIRHSFAIEVKQFADDVAHAFSGHGQMKPKQLEVAQLKHEVTKLKAERDIPKKAAAYFAKEST